MPTTMNDIVGGPAGNDAVVVPRGVNETVARPAPAAAPVTAIAASATREYISGTADIRLGSYLRALPLYIDDITRDLGDDIYERMCLDSQVYSCLEIYKLSILEGGWSLQPSFGDKDNVPKIHKRRAKKVMQFCERVIKQLEQPMERTLYELLAGAHLGSKLAEVTHVRVNDIFDRKVRVHIKSIKVKPRRCISYVVDAFTNVVGFLANIPGQSLPVYRGSMFQEIDQIPNLLPRDKCILYTHNPQDNDPQGRSVLRPVYDPWWHKLQAKAEFIRYLSLYAVPSVYGVCGEKAQGQNNLTAEQIMANALQTLRSGSAAAFPFGSTVGNLSVPGNVSIFTTALDWYDRQIAKGILGQTLATEEGQHQARAAAETHRDIMDTILLSPRKLLSTTIRNDLLRVLVRLNFGKQWARHYTPHFVIGSTSPKEDMSIVASVVASLIGCGFLAPNQYAFYEEKLGLPPGKRDQQSQQSGQQQGQPQPGQQQQQQGDPNNPQPPQAGQQQQGQSQPQGKDDSPWKSILEKMAA